MLADGRANHFYVHDIHHGGVKEEQAAIYSNHHEEKMTFKKKKKQLILQLFIVKLQSMIIILGKWLVSTVLVCLYILFGWSV